MSAIRSKLVEAIDRLMESYHGFPKFPVQKKREKRESYRNTILEIVDEEIKAHVAKTEMAYGGCHNCYGKGYATVNDRWSGYDTDQDIGSPGGKVSGGNPNVMKFCICPRGEQLAKMVEKINAKNN